MDGKVHRLVKAKVIQQCRQTNSKRIGGDINVNVEISDDERLPFMVLQCSRRSGNLGRKESVRWYFLLGDKDRRAAGVYVVLVVLLRLSIILQVMLAN